MKDRKQALTDLLAKVEAGQYAQQSMRVRAGLPDKCLGAFTLAFEGSLDAAKALHEAVLPGWTMDQMNEWYAHGKSAGWFVSLLRHSEPRIRASAGEFDMLPARAWLIAILKALIAEEKTDE